ncbi:copper resistance protein CopC [Sphaerisporangium sp. NPDC005289]|uniref:copper resistance CopC family protein n=1 Tax=Sphaerisporangium sp. NPDC005289 TaxID=3155247 RepID=UPI00339E9C3C
MRSLIIRTLLLCASVVLLVLPAAPALAHDSLKSSSPAKNAVVDGLDQIELEFSAHVSFPVVILHDAAGRRYESGPPRADGPKVVEKVAAPLPSGAYVIAWRIVSSDGHPVEGEIPFTVRSTATGAAAPPPATATPGPSTANAPATGGSAPAASEQGVSAWVWGAPIALVVILAVLLLLGRRKGAQDAARPDAAAEDD